MKRLFILLIFIIGCSEPDPIPCYCEAVIYRREVDSIEWVEKTRTYYDSYWGEEGVCYGCGRINIGTGCYTHLVNLSNGDKYYEKKVIECN